MSSYGFVTPPPLYKNGKVDDSSQAGNAALVNPRQTGVRDAGSGRGIIPAAQRSRIFDMTPRARQLYLRSMGFNVKVDGKSGPQTASAAWSFTHGHDASFFNHQGRDWQQSIWNQHFAKFHTSPSPHDPSTLAHESGAGTPVDKNNHGGPGNAGDAQFSGSPMSGLGADIGQGVSDLYALAKSGTLVDPKQGALVGTMRDANAEGAAAAEAQYGQSIRDNARLIQNLPGEGRQHIADIKSWYGQVADKQNRAGADNAAMADALIKSSGAASAGLVNALGGDANASAGDLASAGEQEAASLRALKLAGALGSSDLSSAIGAEGLSARTRQRLTDENALTDAQNKATDLAKSAGAASTLARSDALAANNSLSQTRYSNRMGATSQNNALIGDRAQRTAAALAAEEGAAALGPDLAYKSALAAAAGRKALATPTTKLPKGAFDNTDAKTKGVVADSAVQAAQGIRANKGTVEDAVKTVNNLYRSRGWSLKNPRVKKAVIASLRGAGWNVDPTWWDKFK